MGEEPPTQRIMQRVVSRLPFLARSFAAEASPAGVEKFEDLKFSFAVPARVLVDNKSVVRVTLPGRGGTLGVERNMPPTVAELRPGVVLVEFEKGEKEEFFVPVRRRVTPVRACILAIARWRVGFPGFEGVLVPLRPLFPNIRVIHIVIYHFSAENGGMMAMVSPQMAASVAEPSSHECSPLHGHILPACVFS